MSDETADNILKLPEVADLTFVQTLKQRCEQALQAGAGLTIDAGVTQRISTPCLQVLVSASLSFEKAGSAAFTVTNASGAFADTAATLGLSQFFKLAGA